LRISVDLAFSDGGIENLKQFPRLQRLKLEQTSITDQSMRLIGELRGLKELNVRYTSITDKGLDWIKELHQLRWLYIEGTKVTVAAADRLRKALPKATVYLKVGDRFQRAEVDDEDR
jgi:hypothetical protein